MTTVTSTEDDRPRDHDDIRADDVRADDAREFDTTRDRLRDDELAETTDTGKRGPKDVPARQTDADDTKAGKVGGLWFAVVIAALVTILLLVFVLQNNVSTEVEFLAWQFSMPLGVLILFAAIAGALIMAMLAALRIVQLRLRATKRARAQKKTARR